MKKSIIYTTLAALVITSGTAATVLLNNANAEADNPNTLNSLTDPTTLATSLSASKNETVYIITDSTGTPTKTFLGNILETSESNLPVELKITYSLDDTEISATDLTGKSGHVKITYAYTSTKSYQNKLVPFLALTGLQLDGNKFTNLKIENGKIISEGDSIMVAGYAFAGLGDDLNTSLVPNSFTIEADVTDFSLETTYTLATNEIFTDLDTSKLSTVDELISSMSQLESGIDQILSGSTELSNGLESALAGTNQLYDGAKTLSNGTAELSAGASKLSAKVNDELTPNVAALNSGLSSLSANSASVTGGAMQIFQALLNNTSAEIGVQLTPDNYATVLNNIISNPSTPASVVTKLAQTKYLFDSYTDFYTSLSQYTGTVDHIATKTPALNSGIEQLVAGTSSLADGAAKLQAGSTELTNGLGTLVAGETELYNGSVTLKNGIATFKADGIDKLVDFATNDLANFTANLRSTVNAAKSYHNYKSTSAESVKFIFKTPSIK